MSNPLTYKNYTGSVEYTAEDEMFHGKVEFIADTVLYEGSSVEELKEISKKLWKITWKLAKKSGYYEGHLKSYFEPDLYKKAKEEGTGKFRVFSLHPMGKNPF